MKINKQSGFTLVELMVSLALGLIVVASAIMLFLTGAKSSTLRQGAADLQDNANFGLNYITKDVRLANLDAKQAAMNDKLRFGGIVLTKDNLPTTLDGKVDAKFFSQSNLDTSNTDQKTDQLVIQYLPTETGGFDCEGNLIDSTEQMVVQRYFLREDSNKAGEASPLVLACDAGRYNVTNPITIQGLGGDGEILMKRVDYFRVLLNVGEGNQRRYIGINEYLALATKPRILGVSLGVLARSNQNVGQDTAITQTNSYIILDKTVVVKDTANPKGYLRQVVTQEVAMRNALGDRE